MTSVVRIHHLPPKQKDIPKGMSFFCFGGRWCLVIVVIVSSKGKWVIVGRAALSPPIVAVCRPFTRRGEGTPPYGRVIIINISVCVCKMFICHVIGMLQWIKPMPIRLVNHRNTHNRRGAQCAPEQLKIIRFMWFVGEQCSPLRDRLCRPKNIFPELTIRGQFSA